MSTFSPIFATASSEIPLDTIEDGQSSPSCSEVSPLILAAQDYAARGYVLIPTKHDKLPIGTWINVSLDTNDSALLTLTRPYMTDPDGVPLYPQLALQCGRSGLCVVDVDVKDGKPGIESLAQLQKEFGAFPPTPCAQSGTGGLHFYFAGETPKMVGFRPAIDIQSYGSYIIAPPSVNAKGQPYIWIADHGLDDVPLAPVPDWLREELVHGRRKTAGLGSHTSTPRPRLTGEGTDADTSPIAEGTRNDTLFKLACSMRGRGLTQHEISQLIIIANELRCKPPLADETVATLVASACKYPPGTPLTRLEALYATPMLSPAPAPTNGPQHQEPEPSTAATADTDIQMHLGELTEVGNAARLLHTYRNDVLYVNNGFGIGVWQQDAWLVGTEEAASTVKRFAIRENRRLQELIQPLTGDDPIDDAIKDENARVYGWMKQSQQNRVLTSTVNLLATLSTPFTDYRLFDNAPMLLQVANGTLDLQKGELRPPRREDYLTVRSPVPYDATAQCPNFLQFLARIFPDDREMVQYIQWLFGFSLIGHNLNQLLFFFEGQGSNGKSMLASIQRKMLGEDLSWLSDCRVLYQARDEGNRTRNSIAHYHKKRLVILSESDTDQRLAEAFVKAATGEETLVGEHKYGREFAVPISFKFIQLSQHLPKIYNQDWGIWRRVRIVPFTATISEEEKDLSFFANTLQHELPGILRWAVEGARLYQEVNERDILPTVMQERMKSYKEESDFFTRFVDEILEFTPDGFLPETRLFTVAVHWGHAHNIPTFTNAGAEYYKKAFANYQQGKPITHQVKRDRRRVKDGAREGDNREHGFSGVKFSQEGEALYTDLNRHTLTQKYGS